MRGRLVTRPWPDWFPERWTQLSLPQLLDDDEDVGGTRKWSFAIVAIEHTGRVTLPPRGPRRDRRSGVAGPVGPRRGRTAPTWR
jgi:hypothetical protein